MEKQCKDNLKKLQKGKRKPRLNDSIPKRGRKSKQIDRKGYGQNLIQSIMSILSVVRCARIEFFFFIF